MTAKEESIKEPEIQSDAKPRRVSRGYRRIFFLTLFAALALQSFGFFYLQARRTAEVLRNDFKIILTVDSSSVSAARINGIGEALSSNPDVLSLKFISADDGFEIIKEQNPRLAENFVFLGRRPMAEYFELTVSDAALADIDAWVSANLSGTEDARAFYKSGAALAAAYAVNMVKFLNLAAAILLAVLFSFVFFVEGAGVKTAEPRWPGALTGALSYAVSYFVFYALLAPLKKIGAGFFIFTVPEAQVLIGLLTVISGWTFAKWKRF